MLHLSIALNEEEDYSSNERALALIARTMVEQSESHHYTIEWSGTTGKLDILFKDKDGLTESLARWIHQELRIAAWDTIAVENEQAERWDQAMIHFFDVQFSFSRIDNCSKTSTGQSFLLSGDLLSGDFKIVTVQHWGYVTLLDVNSSDVIPSIQRVGLHPNEMDQLVALWINHRALKEPSTQRQEGSLDPL